jgi:hypothetical protein
VGVDKYDDDNLVTDLLNNIILPTSGYPVSHDEYAP